MTIFRLNFLLKVAHILVCQNPSFISTPSNMAAVLCVSPMGSAANQAVNWHCHYNICVIYVWCVYPCTHITGNMRIPAGDTHITRDICIPYQYGCRITCIALGLCSELRSELALSEQYMYPPHMCTPYTYH